MQKVPKPYARLEKFNSSLIVLISLLVLILLLGTAIKLLSLANLEKTSNKTETPHLSRILP